MERALNDIRENLPSITRASAGDYQRPYVGCVMLHVFTQEVWENGIQVTLNMVQQHPGPDVWGGAVGDSIGTAQAAILRFQQVASGFQLQLKMRPTLTKYSIQALSATIVQRQCDNNTIALFSIQQRG